MLPRPRDTKHIACSRCRDRKVKCDGQKPGCRRCQRLGHPCQYIQGKKSHGKGEWVQHLTTFSSQPNKTTPHQPHQSKLPPTPCPLRPKPTIEPSDADPAVPCSRSPSPYVGYAASTPSSSSATSSYDASKPIIVNTDLSFSSSDGLDAWMPSAPCSSLSMEPEFLDAHPFTFSPAESWHEMGYSSGLVTTDAPSLETCDERAYRYAGEGFDASLAYDSSLYPAGATADSVEWQSQFLSAFSAGEDVSRFEF